MKKTLQGFSTLALAAVINLFIATSAAYAETYNSWEVLKQAIIDGAGDGEFNIEPGAVLTAIPGDYLYGGIFSGSLNGGTGDGIANINGLTRPLFEALIGGSVSGIQLTAAPGDPDEDGFFGVTGRGLVADNALESSIENVRAGGEVHFGTYWSFGFVSNLGGIVGTADDVNINNSHFSGSIYGDSNNVGGLVGNLHNSQITNSSVKSINTISGQDNVGGIAGISSNSVIDSSVSVGLIEANTAVGGIVGHATATDITNSMSKSIINSRGDSAGGIAGVLANSLGVVSELSDSIFKGAVVALGAAGQVGGIVGLNYGTLENVSALPMDVGVRGEKRVGGLVGLNESTGVIRNSFFDGNVISAGSVGAIAGVNTGQILNSAASGFVYSGENCDGDLIPDNPTCSGLIVGFNNFGTLTNSISIADLYGYETITNASEFWAGNIFPQYFLNYLNADVTPELWEVDSCFNSNRPFKSSLKYYVSSDCNTDSFSPSTFNHYFTPSLASELSSSIRQIKGFELTSLIDLKLPLKIISDLSHLELGQIIKSSFNLNTIGDLIVQQQMPLQLALTGEIKSKAEVWLKTPLGEWIKLGEIEFDESGEAILPALKFNDLGDYKISFFPKAEYQFEGIDPKNTTSIGTINLTIG